MTASRVIRHRPFSARSSRTNSCLPLVCPWVPGGSILADPGAGVSAIGCVFSQPTRSITANDIRYQLVLGGHVSAAIATNQGGSLCTDI